MLLHRFTPLSNRAKRVQLYCYCLLTRGIVRLKHLTICYVKRRIWGDHDDSAGTKLCRVIGRGTSAGPARAADRGGDPGLWRARLPQYHGEGRVRGGGPYRALFLRVLCQQRGACWWRPSTPSRGGCSPAWRKSARRQRGTAEERGHAVLRAYYQMLKDDPDGARLFVIEIARVGPAVDAVWGALLLQFGEVLARMVRPGQRHQAEAGRTGARRRGRRGGADRQGMDQERLCAQRRCGCIGCAENLPRAGGIAPHSILSADTATLRRKTAEARRNHVW